MTETRSTAPPFTHKGVTFENWWIPDGVNEIGVPAVRSVWVSTCGRVSAGRGGCEAVVQRDKYGEPLLDDDGAPITRMVSWYWAALNKKYVATRCPTLLGAMKEGIAAMARARRVA